MEIPRIYLLFDRFVFCRKKSYSTFRIGAADIVALEVCILYEVGAGPA